MTDTDNFRGSQAGMTVVIIAFAEPPERWGFALAKSGKCWWRSLETRRSEACLEALRERGIDAIVKDPGGDGKRGRKKKHKKKQRYEPLWKPYQQRRLSPRSQAVENREFAKLQQEMRARYSAAAIPSRVAPRGSSGRRNYDQHFGI